MNIIFQKIHRRGMAALAIVAVMSIISVQDAKGAELLDATAIPKTETPATDSGNSNVETGSNTAASSETSTEASTIDDLLNQVDTSPESDVLDLSI